MAIHQEKAVESFFSEQNRLAYMCVHAWVPFFLSFFIFFNCSIQWKAALSPLIRI